MRSLVLSLVLGLAAGCAEESRARPPVFDCNDGGCGGGGGLGGSGGGGGGGGGGRDAGGFDAAQDASDRVDVTGAVTVLTRLPPPRDERQGRAVGAGWTVTVPATDLATATDAMGRFALAGVPLGEGRFGLRTQPPSPDLASFQDHELGAATNVGVLATRLEVLLAVAAPAGVTVDPALAHVVVFVARATATREPASGVGVGLVDGMANVLYDAPGDVFALSTTGTGAAGVALLLNVPAGRTANDERRYTLAVSFGSRTSSTTVRVFAGTVTWVGLTAP